MLTDDDNSGLFAFIIGIIVLVFAGIGLSIAVDHRFSFSSRIYSLERDIKTGGLELLHLSEIHRETSRKLEVIEPGRRLEVSARDALIGQIAALRQRHASLAAARDALRNSIITLEQEFSLYRGEYREATWNAAIGQSLGILRIRGGREYQDAVILRVTDVGLEIRHAYGHARVHAPDLDSTLQDRFQWDDDERRAKLGEERAGHEVLERVQEPPKSRGKPHLIHEEVRADVRNVDLLRGKVIAWRSKVDQLRSERSRALSAAYGSQASPPGSLETWQGRAARLGGELARAVAELAAAKADLAAVSPDDPLLKPSLDRP